MADPKEGTGGNNGPGPGDGDPAVAAKAQFKEWFGEAMTEWADKNKKPARTESGGGFNPLEFLFGKSA